MSWKPPSSLLNFEDESALVRAHVQLIQTEQREKDKQLTEELEALVVERPELRKALSEFSDAKQLLEGEHERRCADSIILCKREL